MRTDKWLWAARCFKSRSMAGGACTAGQVKVNDKTAKPSQAVKIGDMVDVVTPGGRRILEVKALAEKRGPASIAETLYDDQTPEEMKPPPRVQVEPAGARPTKRQRRRLDRLRERW
ncbi:MAG: RNA-binding S4 domain-containing protein [Myxococcota bacterium]